MCMYFVLQVFITQCRENHCGLISYILVVLPLRIYLTIWYTAWYITAWGAWWPLSKHEVGHQLRVQTVRVGSFLWPVPLTLGMWTLLPGEQRGYGGALPAIFTWSPRGGTPNLSVPEEASERKVPGSEGSF